MRTLQSLVLTFLLAASAASAEDLLPVDSAEAVAFGERFARVALGEEPGGLGEVMAVDEMVEESLRAVALPAAEAAGFRTGLKRSLLGDGFLAAIRKSVGADGSLEVLNTRLEDGRRVVRLRMLGANDGGVNYYDLPLKRTRSGVIAEDVYIYMTGEWLTETIANTARTMFEVPPPGLLDRLRGRDGRRAAVDGMGKAQKAFKAGRFAEVLEVTDGVPKDLRESKMIVTMRLLSAAELDDGRYAAALAEHRRLFPEDPSRDFIAIDHHVLKGETAEAVAAVDAMYERTEDPYLKMLSGSLLIEAGDAAAAIPRVEASIEGEPGRVDAHWTAVTAYVMTKRHADTLRALKRLDGVAKLEWGDLSENEFYKDFAASPQYAEWLAYLDQKAAAAEPGGGD